MSRAGSSGAAQNACAWSRISRNALNVLAGAAAGAGVMYFYDPHRGRARRIEFIEHAGKLLRRDETSLMKYGKNLLNRMRGAVAEAEAALVPEVTITDEVLVERVRSRMGHIVAEPHGIRVVASNGVITLEGHVARSEKSKLKHEIGQVPGVERINDRLVVPSRLTSGLLIGLAAGMTLLHQAAKPKAA